MPYLVKAFKIIIFLAVFFLLGSSAKAATGTLSGYAWSENAGWINFAPTGGGVTLNGDTRELRGYAWGENIGWISFNCLDGSSCATADYKINIDSGFSLGCRSVVPYTPPSGGGCPVCPSSEIVPPTISSITSSDITSKSVVVKWNTDEASDSIVEFSTDTSYNFIAGNAADISVLVTSHTVSLLNLNSDTAYHFKIIARDGQGNISRSEDMTFKTLPPTAAETETEKDKLALAEQILKELSAQGIATDKIIKGIIERVSTKPVILADNAGVKDITSYSASIFWQTDKEASSLVSFKIADNPNSQWREVGVTGEYTIDHSITLSDLAPGTKYQYKVKSIDILGNIGESKTSDFTTKQTSVVSEVTAGDIKLTEATISWKTSVPTTSEIDYGLTADYKSTYTAKSKDLVTDHEAKLGNLRSGVTYHFRVKGIDGNNSAIISDDYVFTTFALPVILNYNVESVSDNSVVLNWTSNIDIDSAVIFTNVKTTESRTQGDTKLTKEHVLKIENLNSGTDYILKIEGVDIFGNKANGPEIKIKTLEDKISPVIDFVRTYTTMMQNKERSQAVVAWKTNEPATSQVFLYTISNKSTPAYTSAFDANLTTNHTVVFTDLAPGTAYRFNIQNSDKSGNFSLSDDFSMLMPSNRKSIIQMIVEVFEKMFGWTRQLKI